MDKTRITAVRAVGAAFRSTRSSLCCAGPLTAVTLGVSGAGLASTFEPRRQYFLGATTLLLGFGIHLRHREDQYACDPVEVCASPVVPGRMRIILWIAPLLALVFGSFPWWSKFALS